MSDDDARLVQRTLAGHAGAADALLRAHAGTAYAVALAVTRNPHDAEDLVQDAMVLALERLAECRDPRKFGGWLVRIVRNRALNHRRYLGIRAAEPLDDAGHAASPDSPAADAERADLRDRLTEAMSGLTQGQREVLLMHDLEGWKHREIGDVLGMPEGTVRYHLFNARRAVRARLQALVREEE